MVMLTLGTDPENLEMVTGDGKRRVTSKLVHDAFDRTVSECDHISAFGANKVVPVPRGADHISWVSARLQQSREEVDRGEDLQSPVDCRTADAGQFGHELFRGKRALFAHDGGDDRATRTGCAIAVIREHVERFGNGGDSGRRRANRGHILRLAQPAWDNGEWLYGPIGTCRMNRRWIESTKGNQSKWPANQ